MHAHGIYTVICGATQIYNESKCQLLKKLVFWGAKTFNDKTGLYVSRIRGRKSCKVYGSKTFDLDIFLGFLEE